jgi:tetratricopeptide (TPR) repeat protein
VEFNEFAEARQAFEDALDVQRNALFLDPENGTLMFGTATTLCNLGYLYRFRDMHDKASLVLKEAVCLQERVLGTSHATVLSTMDNLADSYANNGQAVDALNTYDAILERFRQEGQSTGKKMYRAEAVLLFKMSRVHQQRIDRDAQLDALKLALRAIRGFSNGEAPDSLERRIQQDIRACREQIEKDQLKWV